MRYSAIGIEKLKLISLDEYCGRLGEKEDITYRMMSMLLASSSSSGETQGLEQGEMKNNKFCFGETEFKVSVEQLSGDFQQHLVIWFWSSQERAEMKKDLLALSMR